MWPEFAHALLKTVCAREHAEKAGVALPADDDDATYTCGFALVRFAAGAEAVEAAEAAEAEAEAVPLLIGARAAATVANVLQHDSLSTWWSAGAASLPYMRHAVVTPTERETLLGAKHAAAS